MPKLTFEASDFQKVRQAHVPALPLSLRSVNSTFSYQTVPVLNDISEKYPLISAIQYAEFQPTTSDSPIEVSPLRIGLVLSGGQASGGHNVIMGVFDFLKRHHPASQLFGFLGGPKGIFTSAYKEIDEDLMNVYRNQGGFDMICSGRDKIETEEQYANSLKACTALKLDGLIVIGGDDSNTNAALLAEYFLQQNSSVKVIGCPKTIDGDLKNEFIEISFGFDTATKTYNELIGNVCLDAVSTKKYYHFVRLMGRSASHIALECELQTRANLVLIGEEVEAKNETLSSIVAELADMIVKRGVSLGKNYGVVLVPEGLIEFIPEVNQLIKELNELMVGVSGSEEELRAHVLKTVSSTSAELFSFLPPSISNQLLLDRDPHGNVQVAKIDTERLLILLLEKELSLRNYPFPFLAQSYYFGYEGRSCIPSNFDATYCYALGYTAGSLIKYNFTGCMAVCRNLTSPPESWIPAGCPLATMMNMERRSGHYKAVIKKALVELDSDFFKSYAKIREHWKYADCYRIPGPIQFDGVGANSFTYMLKAATDEELWSNTTDTEAPAEFPYYVRNSQDFSPLMKDRAAASVDLPLVLQEAHTVFSDEFVDSNSVETRNAILEFLPHLHSANFKKYLQLKTTDAKARPVNVGVVFLGRQAPGAHNVIDGILTSTEKFGGKVFGFLGGNVGLLNQNYFMVTRENFAGYNNTGGMDFLGRIGDSIRGLDQFEKVKNTCVDLALDGLVIIGATHALTDVAYLSEFFLRSGVSTKIIGVPLTIDNNISHSLFESTVGFDTASRVNCELVGNMMTDCASATKYYYLIRLMGRESSQLTIDCALQTHPNIAVVGEVFKTDGETLSDVVDYTANIVVQRAQSGKQFGTLLVPEGLLLQLTHFKDVIYQVNALMGPKSQTEREEFAKLITTSPSLISTFFNEYAAPILASLPAWFQTQLLTRIDSNGHVQLSLIETERLLSERVAEELKKRKSQGTFKGSFSPVCHFFGYQGRCSLPSLFDCSLGSSYGATAVALIRGGATGYMTTARGLCGDVSTWSLGGIPISALMKLKAKSQYGSGKLVVPSSEVDTKGKAFQKVLENLKLWALEERYSNPGPIQYYNDSKGNVNATLKLNHGDSLAFIHDIHDICARILSACKLGVEEETLRTAVIGLSSVEKIINLQSKK